MDWLITEIQQILRALSQILTQKLFYIGETAFSLSQIVRLLLFSVVAIFIAQTISRLLKRFLLSKLGLDRGSREAIGSMTSYFFAFLGILIILQNAGIDLRSLAVIAGVLGIGIGFGLQNLASNFISGITLLFEQPIRVGDFVQIDDLLGTVETISIRSTILKTLDGVFVIVPNIKFVESLIVNWSYKDTKCRLHIPVGVAYGSDPVLVTEALLTAARMEPGVLSKPSPKVWFNSFGDSCLNFELLTWIDYPQDSEPIKSSLHFLIEHELRQRRIEIPFPQRDLWIKNTKDFASLFNNNSPEQLEKKPNIKPDIQVELKRDSHNNLDRKQASNKSPHNWTLRDLLRRVTYFEKCTDLELRQLIEYGYRQLFPGGQIICQENDLGDSFYIILSGAVEVLSQKTGTYIATLHSGEFFGEMSLLLGTPRTATVKTREDSILFVVERHDLQKLLLAQPSLADQIAEKLSERQQALRDLGILDDSYTEQTPFIRIRKRIQTLFGI